MVAQYRIFEFEDVDDCLTLVPLCARRALDAAGLKLPLAAWQALTLHTRQAIAQAGSRSSTAVEVVESSLSALDTRPAPVAGEPDPPADRVPDFVTAALGNAYPLSSSIWAALEPLERWVLAKFARRDDKTRLTQAYQAIIGHSANSAHLDAGGSIRMINVAKKAPTQRIAVAESRIRMNTDAFTRLQLGNSPKGDVLSTARLAGIMAAKRTWEIIPLCHSVSLSGIDVKCTLLPEASSVTITTKVTATDRTGVEMEALVAASTAALTIYDMLKSIDRGMVIESTRLLSKAGGKSGDFSA
jgi:cyclic pyranopterin phosphate synthase